MLEVIRRLDLAKKHEDARTCPKVRQACEKVGGRRNQDPSAHRGGCRTFLDPRPDDRLGEALASCVMRHTTKGRSERKERTMSNGSCWERSLCWCRVSRGSRNGRM